MKRKRKTVSFWARKGIKKKKIKIKDRDGNERTFYVRRPPKDKIKFTQKDGKVK